MEIYDLLLRALGFLKIKQVEVKNHFTVGHVQGDGVCKVVRVSSIPCKSLRIISTVNLKRAKILGPNHIANQESFSIQVDFASTFEPQPTVRVRWREGILRRECDLIITLPPMVY